MAVLTPPADLGFGQLSALPPAELRFVLALIARPADAVTRLAYADWLEGHGEHWAAAAQRVPYWHRQPVPDQPDLPLCWFPMEVDNSSGADASAGGFGAKFAEVYVDTEFLLTLDTTSLTAVDIGKPVYGVDNFTVTETATDLVPVGVITEVVSTSQAWVSIHGLGERDTGPLVT